MNAEQFNGLVSQAAQTEELRGTMRGGGAKAAHHWRVSTLRRDALTWRVFVEPGTVNDRMAAISYLPKGDPRGWTMPPAWVGLAEMRDLYGGQEPPVVDRLLSEDVDPPHLLLTSPGVNAKRDSGDFLVLPDDLRPEIFRTRAMWEREIWRAVVFLTASPGRYSRVENRLHFPVPPVNRRFRVHLGAKMPNRYPGVAAGGHLALADLYLARVPGRPEMDRLWVRQLCFWSLWTANAQTTLDFDPFLPRDAFLIPGIGGLVLGGIGGGIIEGVTDLVFREVADVYERGATVEFWSAV